jgi:hypothetical protein
MRIVGILVLHDDRDVLERRGDLGRKSVQRRSNVVLELGQ